MPVMKFADWLSTMPDWIAGLPAGFQKFIYDIFQTFVFEDRWKFFVSGLQTTFVIAVGALVLGIIIGVLVALCTRFQADKAKCAASRCQCTL